MINISYYSLLKHRCNLLEASEVVINGLVNNQWSIVTGGANMRCYIDLNFRRPDKDPALWTPEAGRAPERAGVFFAPPGAPIKSGQRVEMIFGPAGVFSLEGAIDEAWTPRKLHHLEIGVKEIGRPLAKGAPTV